MGAQRYRTEQSSFKFFERIEGPKCPECATARGMLFRRLSPDLFFEEAFEVFISHLVIEDDGIPTNASFIGSKTERDYRVCAKALAKFLGNYRLSEISPEVLWQYQSLRAVNPPDPEGKWRCVGSGACLEFDTREAAELWAKDQGREFRIVQARWAKRAGANCIRKEIALAVRILRNARLWTDQEKEQLIRVRPIETDIERAMTVQEQHRFLHVASSRPEFRMIYQYTIVALQTTASTNELRALRLGDVTLGSRPMIQVPRQGAKNKGRMRAIPLPTKDAVWAMEGLIARAKQLGSSGPSDYLFPIHIARERYDPARPMSDSGLKKPWDAVRKAAGMPALRIYDLRHTGITRMAERGVPLPVAMSYAGHMTPRMQQRYTAICMAAQREWGAAVWGGGLDGMTVDTVAGTPGPWGTPRKPVASEPMDAGRYARRG